MCGHPCDDGYPETGPTGNYQPNAFGLHDMSGNVREWVEDCLRPGYAGAPTDVSAWNEANCEKRIVRAGGWIDGFQTVRSACRDTQDGGLRSYQVGIRVARELSQEAWRGWHQGQLPLQALRGKGLFDVVAEMADYRWGTHEAPMNFG